MTVIEKQPHSLESDIENKYNLSSRQIFTLPLKYFVSHYYHFNFDAVYCKYKEELIDSVRRIFNDLSLLNNEASHVWEMNYLFENYVKDCVEFTEEEQIEMFININSLDLEKKNGIEDIFRCLYMINSRSTRFEIRKTNKFLNILKERIFIKYGINIDKDALLKAITISTRYGRLGIDDIADDIEKRRLNGEIISNDQETFDKFLNKIILY